MLGLLILSISSVFVAAETIPSSCSSIAGDCEEVYSKCGDLINEELNNKFAEIDSKNQPDYDHCIDEFGKCSKASAEGQIPFEQCMAKSDSCLESYRNKVALEKAPVQKEYDVQSLQLTKFYEECNSPQSTTENLGSGATVANYEGDVQIYRPGQNAAPINKVQALEQRDKIVTGPKGKAKIIFDDGSAVEIGPNAEFTLEAIAPSESTFKLDSGSIRAFIKKALERRTFKSRGFIATIRGTEFVISSHPDKGISEFDLYEGNVELTSDNTGEKKEISAGQSVIADTNGLSVSPLTQEKWDSLVSEIAISGGKSFLVWIIIGLIIAAAAGYYWFKLKN